jgi:hypothetical protein
MAMQNRGGVTFIETPNFMRAIDAFKEPGLLLAIQEALLSNSNAGVQLKGGMRKARVPGLDRGKGKRGGYRVWYYYLIESEEGDIVFLLHIIDKTEKENISAKDEAALVDMIKRMFASH